MIDQKLSEFLAEHIKLELSMEDVESIAVKIAEGLGWERPTVLVTVQFKDAQVAYQYEGSTGTNMHPNEAMVLANYLADNILLLYRGIGNPLLKSWGEQDHFLPED